MVSASASIVASGRVTSRCCCGGWSVWARVVVLVVVVVGLGGSVLLVMGCIGVLFW